MARKESYKQLMGKREEKELARSGDERRSFWKAAGVRFSTRWREPGSPATTRNIPGSGARGSLKYQYATYTTCSTEVSLAVSESTSTSSRAR